MSKNGSTGTKARAAGGPGRLSICGPLFQRGVWRLVGFQYAACSPGTAGTNVFIQPRRYIASRRLKNLFLRA